MKKVWTSLFALFWLTTCVAAQNIRVSPAEVNINANGATTILLTFNGLNRQRAADACWCERVVSAAPDLGFKCEAAALLGCLPDRYDLSAPTGNAGFNDVMSVPPSVARRAYQAAVDGAEPRVFYVRHFVSLAGGPDEYVAVSCRLMGGEALTPFALTDVKLAFDGNPTIVFLKPGETPPALAAEIVYNGSGRLAGQWEVAQPGEDSPAAQDLLTEGSLSIEARAARRRFLPLDRFNLFLPPNGKVVVPGPDVSRFPTRIEGHYIVLLRIEAADDMQSQLDPNLRGGAVAGFPLPVAHYYVGGALNGPNLPKTPAFDLTLPFDNANVPPGQPVDFGWTGFDGAALYRIEIEDGQGLLVLAALLRPGTTGYRAPSWLRERTNNGQVRWRVIALHQAGATIGETGWRSLRLLPKD